MTAVLLGVIAALAERDVRPDVALGHSLGELAAWSALGGPSPAQTITLAAVRGRALGRVAEGFAGAMLGLPPLDDTALADALALGRAHGHVDLALHNAPGRWVLCGDRAALARIAERYGGSFVPTHGAWHSRRFTPARGEYEAALRELPAIPATPTLICNTDGQLLGDRDPIPLLLDQLDGPVRFAEAMATLAEQRPTDVLLIGPAKQLRALVRENWIEHEVALHSQIHLVETPADIDAIAEALGS
jgi:[acyl-carrier-protein] S-malonyltransferase